MKKIVVISILKLVAYLWLSSFSCFSQNVGINGTGATPNSSAILDVDAAPTNNKGLLVPRLTTAQRSTIVSPAQSLLIYNTTDSCFQAYIGTSWISFGCGGCSIPANPAASVASSITSSSFAANWMLVSGATAYYLDVATDVGFTSFVSGYNNLNVGNVSSYAVSTGLACNTTYYYRVRASSSCGTSGNSNILSVATSACPPATCGTQVFALLNLDAGTMVNSTLFGGDQQPAPYNYKFCYNNVAANCATYGGLYQWNNTMLGAASINCNPCGAGGVQGMCPAGYHIPTDLEWSSYEYCLESNLAPTGSTSLAIFQTTSGPRGTNSTAGPGAKMKVTSSNTPTWDGTNASGFSALPGGVRYYTNATFGEQGASAGFQSATQVDATNNWIRKIITGSGQSDRYSANKISGLSIRCLRN